MLNYHKCYFERWICCLKYSHFKLHKEIWDERSITYFDIDRSLSFFWHLQACQLQPCTNIAPLFFNAAWKPTVFFRPFPHQTFAKREMLYLHFGTAFSFCLCHKSLKLVRYLSSSCTKKISAWGNKVKISCNDGYFKLLRNQPNLAKTIKFGGCAHIRA